jgi:hypothetical protein
LVAVRFVDPPKSDLLAAEEFKLTIGDTAFDAADRLAIINLFGAYAYTYDENELDERYSPTRRNLSYGMRTACCRRISTR